MLKLIGLYAIPSDYPSSALGANLGDREKNLRDAPDDARCATCTAVKVTLRFHRSWKTRRWAALPILLPFLTPSRKSKHRCPPPICSNRLLEIERALGRERREKWGPRTIDLDLLVYGTNMISQEDLIIPHPRMHERRFVLQPLAEIAANVVPGLNKTGC